MRTKNVGERSFSTEISPSRRRRARGADEDEDTDGSSDGDGWGRRRGMGPSAAHARDVRGRGARIGRERSDARVHGRFAHIEHVVVGDVVILRPGVHGRRVRGSRPGAGRKNRPHRDSPR